MESGFTDFWLCIGDSPLKQSETPFDGALAQLGYGLESKLRIRVVEETDRVHPIPSMA